MWAATELHTIFTLREKLLLLLKNLSLNEIL